MESSSSHSAGGSGVPGAGTIQQHSQVSGRGGLRVVQGLVAYKPPRRDENCRICNTLETEGDTENLYDDHIHNFPTKFRSFSVLEEDILLYVSRASFKESWRIHWIPQWSLDFFGRQELHI